MWSWVLNFRKSNSRVVRDMNESRYIVWREDQGVTRGSVRSLLSKRFPGVKVLKARDPHLAIVLMDSETKRLIRQTLPQLMIEEDLQHKMAAA